MTHAADEPWLRAWPAQGLESVDACPVCGQTERSICHAGLIDDTFRVAPGVWTLWRCAGCAGAYLSPRPTAATVASAYERYYTHQAADGGPADQRPGALWRIHRWLFNGYTNRRYGTQRQPATRLGVAAAALLPPVRDFSDREFRHLPRLPAGTSALLDVGCGDGAFLALAHECGWTVLGLEPDHKAAQLAATRGLRVIEGGLEQMDGESAIFDVITLSHVIEHVHDPLQVLRACHRLLKPTGRLWLETPNIDALGHRVFGKHWRGLEAPRHLVLFSQRSLALALSRAGFAPPTTLSVPGSHRWIFERSHAMSQGRGPDERLPLPWALKRQALLGDLRQVFGHDASEFLTVSAAKSA